jgi:opacity protein-like surface antigen
MARYRKGSSRLVVSVCAALLILGSVVSAGAQSANSSSPSNSTTVQAPPSPDFMLGRPRASIGVRGNWMMARGGSDIFDFVTTNLTLERSSFNQATIGGEFAINITPRIDILFGGDYGRSETPSEYRDKVEQVATGTIPIVQTTAYSQLNLSASVKFALVPKGRSISRFAWVPRTVTPYVGAGGGLVDYDLEQTGDFVDFQNDHIFTDVFSSSAWAPSVHAFGGVDIQLHRHLFMSLEGRYMWASAPLEQKFIGFDPIDLAGFRLGGGVHVVF